MRVVQAPRASTILFNVLGCRPDSRAWILSANICPIVPITFFKARVPFKVADIFSETLHIDLNQAEDSAACYAHTYEVEYRSASLLFSPSCRDEIEKSYKDALSRRSEYVYKDSDWLETDAPLPQWDDYRKRIESALKETLTQRAALNKIYAARLPVEIQLPRAYQSWRFNVRVKNKTRVLKGIFDAGTFASSRHASLAGIMAPVARRTPSLLPTRSLICSMTRISTKRKRSAFAKSLWRIFLERSKG